MKNRFEQRLSQVANSNKEEIEEKVIVFEDSNDSLSFVSPTHLVELPSGGKFYQEGHPLKDEKYIEIREMTAKEEDILTNKSFIKKGVVIDKLIESILVDKRIDVSSLLVGDKNAIMVAARISAYEAYYDVTVSCKECSAKNVISIDLNEINYKRAEEILLLAQEEENINFEQLESGNILIQLPKTQWVVECKLMDGIDERKIVDLLEAKKKIGLDGELTISEQISFITVSIDGVSDRELVQRAIDAMPAYDCKTLRKTYQKLVPNVTIQKSYTCSSCEEEQEVEVPFTQEFFWPK